jgi:thioredoxin-like negative regulator of GroEL
MSPIVDGLEEKYGHQLVVKRFNANEGDGRAIMRDYRIPGHPAILIFNRQGQEVQRFAGPQPVEAVEAVLEKELEDKTD